MHARLAVALGLSAILAVSRSAPATAQADAHARAVARASCQSGKHSQAVADAAAALQRDPDEIGPRMRLADALVDQGCYQEAVEVLEVGQQAWPRNAELAGKLRDVRSLVTEQTYIEGLTRAAEGAKFQRNQLRCTRLADVAACEDALKLEPDDLQLLVAKGDALVQAGRAADAVATYTRASQLKPGDDGVKTRLAAAEALQASSQAPVMATNNTAAASHNASRATQPKPAPTSAKMAAVKLRPQETTAAALPPVAVAALEPPKTYSNEAPAGRTN